MIIAIRLKDYTYNYYSEDKDSLQFYSCTRDYQDIILYLRYSASASRFHINECEVPSSTLYIDRQHHNIQ